MPALMIVSLGEAKAMATKQKASRAITKELPYLLSRLYTADATTVRIRVVNGQVVLPFAICGRCDAALARLLWNAKRDKNMIKGLLPSRCKPVKCKPTTVLLHAY